MSRCDIWKVQLGRSKVSARRIGNVADIQYLKHLLTTDSKLVQKTFGSLIGWKTLWLEEEMLVYSILSVFQSVFCFVKVKPSEV